MPFLSSGAYEWSIEFAEVFGRRVIDRIAKMYITIFNEQQEMARMANRRHRLLCLYNIIRQAQEEEAQDDKA